MKYSIEVISSAQGQSVQWEARNIESSSGIEGDISLNPGREYQEMIGFGGAFTEAAAYTLSRMSPAKRTEALTRYFDPVKGLGYSIGRVAIHSCDFALGNYTYIEDGDTELKSFSLAHEDKWLFPVIREAEKIRGEKITLLASPWSPPAWMKDNGEMNHGGSLLPEYRQLWADYFARYIREMREQGFDLQAVTVQNEPAAVQVWDSCIYSGEEERNFVRDHLGPTLEKNGLGDVKILIWDHNRDIIVERAQAVLDDPEAAKFVWGVGLHWYVSEEFDKVGQVHELYPDKHILFTEGCQEGGVHLGSWKTGERYARNMIGDFNNWCEGYLDWNIVLDEAGGPNHVNNLCDAPIIADTEKDVLHYNSSFYYIGHFSKYIAPRARRIEWSGETTLPCAAFANPDGTIVAVLLNEEDTSAEMSISCGGEGIRELMEPHSIRTVIWKPAD